MAQVQPPTYDAVVPLLQRLQVQTAEGPGTAIATASTGRAMIYLVVAADGASAPRWVADETLEGAAVVG